MSATAPLILLVLVVPGAWTQQTPPSSDLPVDEILRRALESTRANQGATAIELLRSVENRRDLPARYFHLLGSLEARAQQFDAAEKHLATAVTLDSNLAGAHYSLGLVRLQRGEPGLALEVLTKAVELDSKNAQNWLALGSAQLRLNDVNEAERSFQHSIELSGNSTVICQGVAVAYESHGQTMSAAAAFERAMTACGAPAPARIGLIRVLLRFGDRERARHLIQDWRASRNDPAPVRTEFGIALARAGMRSEAINEFEAAVKQDPGGTAAYNLALAYYYERRFQESETIARSAVERAGTEELYHLLGAVKEQTGENREARRYYSLAAAANPASSDYQTHIGQLSLAAGEYAGAESYFRAAGEKCGGQECLAALIGLGTSFKLRGDHEAAVNTFERAIKAEPRNYLAFLYLGDSLLRAKRADEAVTALRTAVELAPDSALAHYMYAYALMGEAGGPSQEAVHHLTETLRLDSSNGLAYYRLGVLRRKEGKLSEAVSLLEQAVKLEPKLKQAYYQLGATYRGVGDKVRAADNFSRFRALGVEAQQEDMLMTRNAAQIPLHKE